MKRKGVVRTMLVFSMCLLVVHLHAQEAIQVAGLFSDAISLGCGSEQGVKVGATGRVYLREMVGGKMWPIYIAKFRVTSVEANNCRAKVLEKTRDIAIGHYIAFDKPLLPPAAKPTPAVEPKAEKPQAKPTSITPTKTFSLFIEAVPEDAVIYVNGDKLGRSPVKLELSRQNCDVRVELSGHKAIEDSFTIPSGGIAKSYELKPLAAVALVADVQLASEKKVEIGNYPLRIEVEPADAEITINGQTKGYSPMELNLPQPRCEVRVARRGYETVSETLDLSENGLVKNYKLKLMTTVGLISDQEIGSSVIPENSSPDEIDKKTSKNKKGGSVGWILAIVVVVLSVLITFPKD